MIQSEIQNRILSSRETLERITNLADNADKDSDKLNALKMMGQYHQLFDNNGVTINITPVQIAQKAAENLIEQGWSETEARQIIANEYGLELTD